MQKRLGPDILTPDEGHLSLPFPLHLPESEEKSSGCEITQETNRDSADMVSPEVRAGSMGEGVCGGCVFACMCVCECMICVCYKNIL